MSKNLTITVLLIFVGMTLVNRSYSQTQSAANTSNSERSEARFVTKVVQATSTIEKAEYSDTSSSIRNNSANEIDPPITPPISSLSVITQSDDQSSTKTIVLASPVDDDIHKLAFSDRTLQEIQISITDPSNKLPTDMSTHLIDRGLGVGSWEPFAERTVFWPAPEITYRPLYFENAPLERYGQVRYPMLQPWKSGLEYFGSIGLMPYFMYRQPPTQCEYPLGYCRPGSVVPKTWHRWWVR